MSKPDDGGPAFPVSRGNFTTDGKMLSADWVPGMSLRDYFAAHATEADLNEFMWPDGPPAAYSEVAKCSRIAAKYRYADAMIAERQKGGSDGRS